MSQLSAPASSARGHADGPTHPLRRFRPFFRLGWFLASLNLAVSVYAFAGIEPLSSDQMQSIYSHPPAWDFPLFIAARSIQGPALDGPLLGALQGLNLPALLVSAPFYVLLFRGSRGASLLWASHTYAAVLALLTILQWLLVGRALTWVARYIRQASARAT